MTTPGRRLLRLLPYRPLYPSWGSLVYLCRRGRKNEGCRGGEALPRAPIKRRSPLRHVAIRKPAVLTGTVVPGKACREASCRKSPRCEAPRFTESSSEDGTLVAQARCRDLLATRGSYPRCRTLPHPPPSSPLFCARGYPRGNAGISGKLAGPYPEVVF